MKRYTTHTPEEACKSFDRTCLLFSAYAERRAVERQEVEAEIIVLDEYRKNASKAH